MKKRFGLAMLLATSLALTACGGGGDSKPADNAAEGGEV